MSETDAPSNAQLLKWATQPENQPPQEWWDGIGDPFVSEKTVALGEVEVGHGVRFRNLTTAIVTMKLRHEDVVEVLCDHPRGAYYDSLNGSEVRVTDLGPPRFGPSEADDLVKEFGGCARRRELMEACRRFANDNNEANEYALVEAFMLCWHPPPPREEPEESRKDAGGRGFAAGDLVRPKVGEANDPLEVVGYEMRPDGHERLHMKRRGYHYWESPEFYEYAPAEEEHGKDAGGRGLTVDVSRPSEWGTEKTATGETVEFKFKLKQEVRFMIEAFPWPQINRLPYMVQELRATLDGLLVGISRDGGQIALYDEDKLELLG